MSAIFARDAIFLGRPSVFVGTDGLDAAIVRGGAEAPPDFPTGDFCAPAFPLGAVFAALCGGFFAGLATFALADFAAGLPARAAVDAAGFFVADFAGAAFALPDLEPEDLAPFFLLIDRLL